MRVAAPYACPVWRGHAPLAALIQQARAFRILRGEQTLRSQTNAEKKLGGQFASSAVPLHARWGPCAPPSLSNTALHPGSKSGGCIMKADRGTSTLTSRGGATNEPVGAMRLCCCLLLQKL
jgi:hypothetical protein